jgi:hypothetical protein
MCTIGPVVLNLVEVVMAHMEYAYSFGGLSTGIYNKKHVPHIKFISYSQVKVNFTLDQTMKAQKWSRGISLTSAVDGGGWSVSCPSCFTPGKENRYPLYRRLGGPQGQSGQVRKISPLQGSDPWTVQHVVSHYTWVILAHIHNKYVGKMSFTLVATPPNQSSLLHLFNVLHCNWQTSVS